MDKPTSSKSSEKHSQVLGFSSLLPHGMFLLLGMYFYFWRLHQNGFTSCIGWVALLQVRRPSTEHESLYCGDHAHV